jgi:hypothetical protein
MKTQLNVYFLTGIFNKNPRQKITHFFSFFLFTYVWKSVKIPVCLPADKRKPPAGEGFSGEPQE